MSRTSEERVGGRSSRTKRTRKRDDSPHPTPEALRQGLVRLPDPANRDITISALCFNLIHSRYESKEDRETSFVAASIEERFPFRYRCWIGEKHAWEYHPVAVPFRFAFSRAPRQKDHSQRMDQSSSSIHGPYLRISVDGENVWTEAFQEGSDSPTTIDPLDDARALDEIRLRPKNGPVFVWTRQDVTEDNTGFRPDSFARNNTVMLNEKAMYHQAPNYAGQTVFQEDESDGFVVQENNSLGRVSAIFSAIGNSPLWEIEVVLCSLRVDEDHSFQHPSLLCHPEAREKLEESGYICEVEVTSIFLKAEFFDDLGDAVEARRLSRQEQAVVSTNRAELSEYPEAGLAQ